MESKLITLVQIGESLQNVMIGRTDRCSDFAANIGILFHTPEECFLGEVARPFQRSIEPTALIQVDRQASSGELIPTELPFQVIHNLEVILLCGSPGSGKSTFYEKIIKPLGYERVNQDILKSVCSLSPFSFKRLV